MKLGELKSAIRTRKGNPSVYVRFRAGEIGEVVVQKGSIMDLLDKLYGDKGTETGLYINDEGLIMSEGGHTPNAETVAALNDSRDGNTVPTSLEELNELDDLDDLAYTSAEADYLEEIDEL